MSFTENQLRAIEAKGNTLVIAAAGAGKTGTLVERCIRLLVRPENPVPVRDILVVTFTEAAAAEVRERIRQRLEKEVERQPANEWFQEQLASLDSAYISTLHSFCFEIIRKHLLELQLDPSVSVMEPDQSRILFLNTLDLLMQEHYAGQHPFSGELKEIIRTHFGGWEQRVRDFVEQIHAFTQTRPDPSGWFDGELSRLSCPDASQWESWFQEAFADWRDWWRPYLESLPAENKNAHACAKLLATSEQGPGVVLRILEQNKVWPKNKIGAYRTPIKKLFDEAAFFASLLPQNGNDPLREDWHWMRAPLLTLLRLARQFADRFHAEKIERGVVDFHDLEQFALRLLWDAHAQQPSAIAREWQGRFEAIFVDEYQDINAAQDLIISGLSKTGSKSNSPVADDVRSLTLSAPQNSGRPQKGRRGKRRDSATQPLLNLFGAEGIRSETPHSVSDDLHSRGNRFLVGDVKQSIYRFRQADPAIFRKYLARADWEQVPLSENFRSHESILRFINPLFAWLMKPVFGGLEYTPEAQLRFGASAERAEMQRNSGDKPRVELHLLFTDQEPEEPNGDEEENAGAEIESPELEARLVAKRLRELKESGLQIYHEKEKRTRAAEWKDMVILLRAAKNKLETYSKAFAAAGVPLQTKRNAFFATQEVLDLCNVLNILDNPLQDIPLAAVLRSPMVGLEANELALIRIKSDRRPFWKALNHFFESKIECSAASKIELFLNRYHRWRDGRRCSSLAQRLEQILTETGYTDWLLRQSRGRERYANVGQLLRVARHFDESRGESLYLFLRHIEEIQESFGDIEPAALVEENAVRLMTVHQSKGLEFPIVAVADLGKQFNFTDQISQILLHEKYGLCSMIKPPQTGQRYPSLPLWAARRGERLEAIGEEMRILYVALTRAQNHLLLFGSATQKRAEKWDGALVERPFPKKIIQMRSWLDWLGTHLAKNAPSWMNEDQGETETFGYTIHRQVLECGNPLPLSGAATCPDLASRLTEADLKTFREKPAWPYPHQPATREPAKTSVTLLRKRAESFDEEAMELARRFRRKAHGGKERGLATHAFLEHLDLNGPFSATALQAQTQNLVQQKLLTPEQAEDIGFDSIAAFWNSETGRELLATKQELKRELPFTYKLTAEDLHAAQLSQVLNIPAGEFVIIQGVADLVRIAKSEIWLIDFKTDSLKPNELPAAIERYRPQLTLYALAFASIYQRPVTRRGLYFLDASELVWF